MYVVSFLPIEFDKITKVTKEEDIDLAKELANHKSLCYYVMNNSCVDEDKAIFKRLDLGMQQHLKPHFIWAKVENVWVNKFLVDGGKEINLMTHSLLKKICKYNTNLRPYNMASSNYEGKMRKSLRVI